RSRATRASWWCADEGFRLERRSPPARQTSRRAIMQAAFLFGTRDLRIVEREPLPLRPEDVRVAVACSGICGTDLHVYGGMTFGRAPAQPGALGRGFAGRGGGGGEGGGSVAGARRVAPS